MKYIWAVTAIFSIGKVLADCVTNPADPSCSGYQMNSTLIQNDLNSLCSQMSFMPVRFHGKETVKGSMH